MANAAWYADPDFIYRQKITIDAGQVDADLTDFPIYLNTDDLSSGFYTHALSTCADVRITKSDETTEVPREIVFCDGTNGEIHFKASGTLSSTINGDFYIYYGNGSAADYATSATYGAENVWDSNYAAVYHLQEDPSGSAPQMLDSTSNSYDGTSAGSMTSGDSVAGKLAGNSLDLDGSNDDILIGTTPDWAITDTFTWQTWIKTSIGTGTKTIIGDGNSSSPYDGINFFLNSGALHCSMVPTSGIPNSFSRKGTNTYADGAWHSMVLTYAGTSAPTGITLYEDGVEPTYSVSSGTWSGSFSIARDLQLGTKGTADNWNGGLDEVRLSNIVRTATWVSTEYNNQSSPSTFYSVGTEETDTAIADDSGANKRNGIVF